MAVNHDEAAALLDAFLDGELDAATTGLVQAHVRGCEQCTAALSDRTRLQDLMRGAPLHRLPPPDLRARLEAGLRAETVRVRVRRRWPEAVAAGFALAITGLLIGRSLPRPLDLTMELADAHARSVLSQQAMDVASSDHHTVKPWLSAHLPFSPPVPAMYGNDDELLGGRVDVINRQPVAALVYRHGKHRVDVFVWPTASMPGTPSLRSGTDGYRLTEAVAGEFHAVFVADMSPAEMDRFRDAWRDATAPR